MSRKVMDCCNRWRSKTVSFRMSPEEDALLDSMVRLSGMTKQDYITSRLECRDINVSPNVRVYRMLRDQMKSVYVELRRLRSADGIDERLIHAVASHGYALTVDIAPEHEMEKVLYAADELTGLIGAVALMRPSKSVSDMEVKSVRKKYKDRKFAAGCSREVIERGAAMLGWELNTLIEKTILAMRASDAVD